MGDEINEALFDLNDSESPDLGDEWRIWHMDDPSLTVMRRLTKV